MFFSREFDYEQGVKRFDLKEYERHFKLVRHLLKCILPWRICQLNPIYLLTDKNDEEQEKKNSLLSLCDEAKNKIMYHIQSRQ